MIIPEVERAVDHSYNPLIGRDYVYLWHDTDYYHYYFIQKFADKEELESSGELSILDVELHSYDSVEEEVEWQLNYRDMWVEAVDNNDTDASYDDWCEDNCNSIRDEYCDNTEYVSYDVVENYEVYNKMRDIADNVYYYNQLEDNWSKDVASYEDFLHFIEDEYIDEDDIDERLLDKIKGFFMGEQNNYEYVS